MHPASLVPPQSTLSALGHLSNLYLFSGMFFHEAHLFPCIMPIVRRKTRTSARHG